MDVKTVAKVTNKNEYPMVNSVEGQLGRLRGWTRIHEDAKVAEAKRMVFKREKRILERLPESETTVYELRDGYIKL